MSRPNVEPKRAAEPTPIPAPPPHGAAEATMAATGEFSMGGPPVDDPTLRATLDLAPPGRAGVEETIQVTGLAFPRAHVGTDPGETLALPPTIPPKGRRQQIGDTADTLDSDGRTNAFSMSSLDGSAEVIVNDLPRVKGYTLLSELGRGGMGVVYQARQDKLDRLVALKMVLAGAHASQDQLNRFLVEAQAVAHLTHNHIVQIFDVGERDGLPFFSLEFVDGGSLQQAIGGKPQPVRYSAQTMKTLCEAMGFAHDQGIIHRDLKPANVLMTKGGEPKITDFGLAKRLEGNSQQTRDGAIMGTPSYMAPEQAWGLTGEIGPLADQHALGAMLYEMLTGRPPYQGTTPLDTLDQVRNQEPVPPTRLQPKIPKDLETICLKALQKDAAKRYESCKAMAEDLGRYLDEKPILARPVSAPERAWRWCKRNRTVAALSGLAAASVLAFAGVSFGAAMTLNKNNKDLTVAKLAETDAKLAALKREAEAKALALAAQEQTQTMLEAQRYISILANMRLKDIPGTLEVRREMFKVALMSMDRATKDVGNLKKIGAGSKLADAMYLRTLAGIHQQRGLIYADMGPRYADKVWPEFEQMDKLAEQHYAMDPDDLEAVKNMAGSKLTLGEQSFALKSDPVAAERYLKQAVQFRRKWLDKWPTDDVAKQALSNALGALAKVYQSTGSPAKAVPFYEEEAKLRQSVGAELLRDSEFRRETAGLYEKLGDLQTRLGKVEEGRKFHDQTLEERLDIARSFPGHPQAERDVLLSNQDRGHDYLIQRKDPATAAKYYRGAVDGFRERLKADAQAALPKDDLARALYFLGTALLEAKDVPASDAAYAESLVLRRDLSASPSAKTDATRSADINLMLGLARAGDHAAAAAIAEDLQNVPPANPYLYFQVACGYSLAAAAADRHAPNDAGLEKKYLDGAYKALRDALKAGWRSAEEIATDPDLAFIRTDPGFPALLEEFRAAK